MTKDLDFMPSDDNEQNQLRLKGGAFRADPDFTYNMRVARRNIRSQFEDGDETFRLRGYPRRPPPDTKRRGV